MDNRAEQQPKPPRREIPLGRWFEPFQSYNQIPYTHEQENYKSKSIRFNSPGIGEWGLVADWDNAERTEKISIKQAAGKNSIILLPNKEIIVPTDTVLEYQKQSELSLMEIGNDIDQDWYDNPQNAPPYELLTKLPSGLIIKKNFRQVIGWKGPQNEDYDELLVPDGDYAMQQLEMMIEHAGDFKV